MSREELKNMVFNNAVCLMDDLEYNAKDFAVKKIVDEWYKNKSHLLDLFEKHPNYNGRGQIVFSENYSRKFDIDAVERFWNWVRDVNTKLQYGTEDWSKTYNISFDLQDYNGVTIDDELAKIVNEKYPEVRARAGQKLSKVTRKVLLNIPKIYNYKENDKNIFEREYAKYADAVSPLNIVRHTILSVNMIDYWTMSFGNSWTSCHSIDINDVFGLEGDDGSSYDCCYSYGTESYMMDRSSIVFYTVDSSYNGTEFEFQRKINRCMFHLGEDGVLVQGRVYPGTNDTTGTIYESFRNIVQKVISECFNMQNRWKLVKGPSACKKAIDQSTIYHYPDYNYFDNCNVSYPYNGEEDFSKESFKKIQVGHKPICPRCGYEHTGHSERILCDDCVKHKRGCENCGRSGVDLHEINGDYYCDNCSFWCEYHEEWETDPDYSTYVEGYGYVCENAIDSVIFIKCDNCENYYLLDDSDVVVTDDGKYFCGDECAEDGGYIVDEYDNIYKDCNEFNECCICGCLTHQSHLNIMSYCKYCEENEEKE